MAKRSRNAVTDAERKALRTWFFTQYPRPRQAACAEWFLKQFNHPISISTVSDSLGDRYKYLDSIKEATSAVRHQTSQWPLLDKALIEWQVWHEEAGHTITGDILIQKAKEFWT
jgi:hypothetical protein